MIFKVFAGGAGKSRQVLEFLHFGALLRDILIKGLEPARAGKFCKTYQIISNSIFRIAPGHPYTFLTLTFTTCSETLVFEPGVPALDSRGEQTWMPSCCAHNAYDSSKTGDAGGALATALATSSAGSSGNNSMATENEPVQFGGRAEQRAGNRYRPPMRNGVQNLSSATNVAKALTVDNLQPRLYDE